MSGEGSYDNDVSEYTQCIATQIFYFRSSKYQYWLWFSKSTTISVWIKKINHATKLQFWDHSYDKVKKKANLVLSKTVLERKVAFAGETWRDWTKGSVKVNNLMLCTRSEKSTSQKLKRSIYCLFFFQENNEFFI